MLKTYFKTALRNLQKSKTYTAINIIGLSVGLAGFITILLYLNHELSYDKWDPALEKVYKISMRSDEDILPQTPAPLAGLLMENSSLVESATTMTSSGDVEVLLSTGDSKIFQDGCVEADSAFLQVFPYKIVRGNAISALSKPNAVIISEEVAGKLFGTADPIGKTIKVFNAFDCEVTAVMQNPGKPSHLNTQIIYRSPYEKQNQSWANYSFQTYVKTKQVVPVLSLEQNTDAIYFEKRIKEGMQTLSGFRKDGHRAGLFAEAVSDLHNFPRYGKSNFRTVSVLLILAGLLLLAGAINFSNLSVAASVRRAKEVGVRKVLGSSRRQLVMQFMSEVALECFISLCVALILVNLILPYFNREFNITLSLFSSPDILSIALQIALCLLAVIILCGLYPAVFLSYYNVSKVLKADYSRGTKGASFRNALITVQFSLSAFFIIGILVISRQMDYLQNKDTGFSGKQVMRIEATQKTRDKDFDLASSILSGIPGVESVSKTTIVPGDIIPDTSTFAFNYAAKQYRMASVKVSTNYFKTLSIELLRGRPFNNSYADQHTRSAIINEAAARKLNLENPIGAMISFSNSFSICDSVPVQVVGVVKDFNVSGFENIVQPVVFTIGNNACIFQSGGALLVKLDGDQIQKSIAGIEQAWKKIEPDFPIRYSFLDENFQQYLASYIRLQRIMTFFGATAILISAMGLFALTAFMVSQRTKEIAIRKILGAGMVDVGLLLSRNFIWLVLIAVFIAIPAGWWAADKWLQGFAYRIDISWWMFALPGITAVIIALLTVSFQVLKASLANPVKSLRSE